MGDKSRHITYFKVENFKRFESFEMKDIGQFNLIVGDNNVGKTSVLESLLVTNDAFESFNGLFSALQFKRLTSDYTYGALESFVNVNAKQLAGEVKLNFTFTINSKDEQSSIIVNNRNNTVGFETTAPPIYSDSSIGFRFHEKSIIKENRNLPFIPFYRGHDSDLINFYGRLQDDKSLKKRFIENLKILVPEIESVDNKTIDSRSHLIVYQNFTDKSVPLAFFGDGLIKLFRLLAEIILNKGSRLMIDEVDTGIHYSRFRDFWKVILTAAKENDVQLFMTTHNEECIKYFKEVLENDLPELKEDVRSISLVENHKTKEVLSFTYSFEELESNVNLGNEIRG